MKNARPNLVNPKFKKVVNDTTGFIEKISETSNYLPKFPFTTSIEAIPETPTPALIRKTIQKDGVNLNFIAFMFLAIFMYFLYNIYQERLVFNKYIQYIEGNNDQ
jgi:hypothetical protein